jgi:hypothetical protein
MDVKLEMWLRSCAILVEASQDGRNIDKRWNSSGGLNFPTDECSIIQMVISKILKPESFGIPN